MNKKLIKIIAVLTILSCSFVLIFVITGFPFSIESIKNNIFNVIGVALLIVNFGVIAIAASIHTVDASKRKIVRDIERNRQLIDSKPSVVSVISKDSLDNKAIVLKDIHELIERGRQLEISEKIAVEYHENYFKNIKNMLETRFINERKSLLRKTSKIMKKSEITDRRLNDLHAKMLRGWC